MLEQIRALSLCAFPPKDSMSEAGGQSGWRRCEARRGHRVEGVSIRDARQEGEVESRVSQAGVQGKRGR